MRGQHKLLMPLGGKPVIRHTVERLWAAGPQEVVVVTGHQALEISAALADMPIKMQLNPRYEEGQMTSAAVGVGALQMATDAVMMCLGDMVLLGSSDYAELAKVYLDQTDRSIVIPYFQGQRGNPILFASSYVHEVAIGERHIGCKNLQTSIRMTSIDMKRPTTALRLIWTHQRITRGCCNDFVPARHQQGGQIPNPGG